MVLQKKVLNLVLQLEDLVLLMKKKMCLVMLKTGWHIEDSRERAYTLDEFKQMIEGTEEHNGKPGIVCDHSVLDPDGWPVDFEEFS